MAKKSAFGVVSLLFIISIGGALPILYFDLIEPRLGVMNAHIGIAALEISAVDDASITLVIKLRVIDPSGKTIIFPKLDLIALAGFSPLGTAWNPVEWVITPESWLLDYNAILYLRCLRGEDAGLTPLLDALLHGSDLPLTFSGNALIGSLPFNIPPFSFSLAGISIFDPVGEILGEIEEEIRDESAEDVITMFFDYIQENGVDFEELAQTVTMDAEGLIEFLDSYAINVFSLFYYMDVGKEWYEGFGIDNNSKIENIDDRVGVKQSINSLKTGDPAKDIMTNLLKIAWDLDDREVFNGTPYSRVDNSTYEQPIQFETMLSHVTNYFSFNQSYEPKIFSNSLVESVGFNDVLRDRIGGMGTPGINFTSFSCSIEPTRNLNNEYYNDTTEEWDIIPGVNFTLDPKYEGKDIYYVRLGFFGMPPLDMEGDGNVSTFSSDNLSIYDLDTFNVLDPEASLLWRCDGNCEIRNYELWGNNCNNELTYRASSLWPALPFLGLPGPITYYLTPWLPATSLKVIFKTNGTNSQDYWGFRIEEMDFEFDTDPLKIVKGNYTTETLDNDSIDVDHGTYFSPTAFLLFDLWHQAYAINQTQNIMWDDAWEIVTMNVSDVPSEAIFGMFTPPINPIADDFTSDGMSNWDLLWWFNYHYDLRYLLEVLSDSKEASMIASLVMNLLNPIKQAEFFYGTVDWFLNDTYYYNLQTITDFPTMSPAHALVDFLPGAPFANMVEPYNFVRIWERNDSTGQFDITRVVNHTDYYGIADIEGTGGPYGADASYMKTLKYNDTGFLENMLYLALTQDSRHPNSVWRIMYDITKNICGASFNETVFNITQWNTKPLPINIFLEALNNASEAVGGESGGVASLLYGVDTLELLEYLGNKTGTTLGHILDAAGVRTYDLIEFFAENIEPTFPPIPVNQNIFSLNELFIYLIPAFIAIPAIAIYVYVSQKQTRSEIPKK